jgi:mono/diheme cytochrome c family protein
MQRRPIIQQLLAALLLASQPMAYAQTDLDHGKTIFFARCAICHGVNADGQSDLARIMRPPPANLRASKLDEMERSRIVRGGGASVGRSPNMPEWQLELNDQELLDVVAFIGTLKEHQP